MKNVITLILLLLICNACQEEKRQEEENSQEALVYSEVIQPDYELYHPTKKPKAVLVLFGGYPESAEDIKREFKILEKAKKKGIAVLFSNFNQKLWLEKSEQIALAEQLQKAFLEHKLPSDHIYLGGFSSGGNVALLIGDYLAENTKLKLAPKGIFIVDSPIDLAALYTSAEKNVERNFSAISVQEGKFIMKMLGDQFGNPATAIEKYEEYAVFTSNTNHTQQLKHLKNTKLRLYTEPDTLWWKENRMADYDQMNAYYIKKLSESLSTQGFEGVEYIPTKDKGYRANGERHPHSWAIVDADKLIDWVLGK